MSCVGTPGRGKQRPPRGARSELETGGFEALATGENVFQERGHRLRDAGGGEAWRLGELRHQHLPSGRQAEGGRGPVQARGPCQRRGSVPRGMKKSLEGFRLGPLCGHPGRRHERALSR